ncbi:MAG TPA: ABC transporter substrate-binding protein, partial [Rhodoglobus sp.]|nr:ABC transporter substrate-binding protein [Rhodoglobus sp.]
DRPVVFAWKPLEPLNVELMRFERNPYFSQIDAEGNQLPYLDALQFRLFESPDTFNMWILNGEIDMQARHVDLGNYTLFKEGEAQGGYTLGSLTSSFHTCFTPNHSTKDQRLAGLFQDRRFRLAMSYAVNRQEINDLVYNGLATPRQYSPIEGSPQYYPKLSNAYLEYDPEQANQLLDEIGISARDAEGFRLWNDGSGETITFTIEGIDNPGSPGEDHAQMEVKYFADVGIKATYKYVERSLYTEHYEANMIEAAWVIWNNRTVLPLVAPGVSAGALLCFTRALGEFGATITFAGSFPGVTQTLPIATYLELQRDPDAAIALSLTLMVVSVAVLVTLRDRWVPGLTS